MWASMELYFQVYGRQLTLVSLFKYLGQVLTASDNDWTVLMGNLRKACMNWAKLLRVLGRKVANTWVLGIFFKEVFQMVLLFRS